MDQNKILWIVAAVGAFLLVVLGAALIFYTPKANTDTQIQNLDGVWTSSRENYQNQNGIGLNSNDIYSNGNNYNEFASNSQDYLTPNPATRSYESYNENPIDIEVPNQKPASSNAQMQISEGQSLQTLNLYTQNTNLYSENTTIDLNDLSRLPPRNQTAPVSNVRDLNASPQTTKTESSPKTTQTTTPIAQAVKTSTSTKTAASTQVLAKTVIEDKFWIQASSFSSKINAEELKANLTKENFVSEIFTFTDNKNNLFYRVRIGPYTTKTEAEYWQEQLLKTLALKGTETYITNSSVKK